MIAPPANAQPGITPRELTATAPLPARSLDGRTTMMQPSADSLHRRRAGRSLTYTNERAWLSVS